MILVETGGEYVGDIVVDRPDVMVELRKPIDHILEQL